MEWARRSAELLEGFARLVTSENPQMLITCGGETREDLYDGVLEVLNSINYKIAEEPVFDCGFTTPEEASEEGTKRLKAISRRLWYELIYDDILHECEEKGIAYLDMFKILEFEAWSEAAACYFRPPSERPIPYFEDEND